jgi:hypothetical protein
MTQTAIRIIPKQTPESVLDPSIVDALQDVRSVVREYFDGIVEIFDVPSPAFYPDGGFMPVPHWRIEFTVIEDRMDAMIGRIRPVIEEIIARYSRPVAVSTEP